MSKIELYPYQKKAIERLDSGKVLYAGVGVGKSLTALSYYIQKEKSGRLIVITTPKKRNDGEWLSEASRLDMNLDNIVVDSWNNIEKYTDIENQFFIFDEQRAVGSGKWANTFIKIAKKNRWIMLTATPGDTWMDFVPLFLANRFYRNRTDFNSKHVIFNTFVKFPQVRSYINVDRLIELKKNLLVEMVKPKEKVVNKLVKEWIVSYDKELYSRVSDDFWDIFKDEPITNSSQYGVCLRRVCNESTDKLAVMDTLMARHPKVIIFYSFDHELDILTNYLTERGIPFAQYNGHKHDNIPDTDSWAYLVQYSAGAEGWNCVLTDTIIFFSKTYSYKSTIQAAGRIDRLNTPFDTLYYYYLKTNSEIDKRIDKNHADKKDFNINKFYKEKTERAAPFDIGDPFQCKFDGFY